MIREAAARLRRTAAAMRAGEPIPPKDALPLAAAILDALDGRAPLDVSVGLVSPSPLSRQALTRRAQLISRLSDHYAGDSISIRAKRMEIDAGQYATILWPPLRGSDGPPEIHAGQPEGVLFLLHQEAESGGAKWPLKWRHIYGILDTQRPVRWDAAARLQSVR